MEVGDQREVESYHSSVQTQPSGRGIVAGKFRSVTCSTGRLDIRMDAKRASGELPRTTALAFLAIAICTPRSRRPHGM